MRTSDLTGLMALGAATAVAAVMGWHGLRHPGPILAAAAGGRLGVATTGPAAGAGGPSAKAAHGGGGTANGGSTSTASGQSGGSGGGSTNSNTGSGGSGGAAGASTLHATTTRLSQTAYAQYAVAVYPRRAPGASQALYGFNLKIVPDGSSSERLEVFIPGVSAAALNEVIARTDKVYFVEGAMGDDAPGYDTNGGDDGLVVTNAQGYILQ